MQQQISNGVPLKLAKTIAEVVKQAIMQYNIRNRAESLQLV
jgi:DNA (cytosine-5)-methyltransferase 1